MKGYTMFYKGIDLFFTSDAEKKCKSLIDYVIDGIGAFCEFSPDQIEKIKGDKMTRDYIKNKLNPATLEYKQAENGFNYIAISGKDFSVEIPQNEYDAIIIFE